MYVRSGLCDSSAATQTGKSTVGPANHELNECGNVSIRVGLCLLTALVTSVANAHHSSAPYDFGTVAELEGEIVAISWSNPHVRLTLKVEGSTEGWELVAQDVNSLVRLGLSAEMLNIGDKLRVAGHPLRRGGNSMYLTNVLLPDGLEIRTRGEDTEPRWSQLNAGFQQVDLESVKAAADEETGLFRVWMSRERKSFPGDLPLTPEARSYRESWNPADSLIERCVTPGMPAVMRYIGAPHPVEFYDGGAFITLRMEIFDIERTIQLDSGDDSAVPASSPLGHSIGRWEGDTLVVETSLIEWPYLNEVGSIPQSRNMTTLEKFSVNEAEDTLTYSLAMTDPETLTETVTIEWLMDWRPDLEIEAYDCQTRGD